MRSMTTCSSPAATPFDEPVDHGLRTRAVAADLGAEEHAGERLVAPWQQADTSSG